MYMKDEIGTIALKSFVSYLQGGGNMKPMNPLDFPMLVIPPSCKLETNNFRGIVAIQFLISIKLSFKWALDEVSMTKLMYLP